MRNGLVLSLLLSCGAPTPEDLRRTRIVSVQGSAADSLVASGATVIEDYGAFRLVAATSRQLAELPEGTPVEVRSTDHLIQLNSGALDTSTAARTVATTAVTVQSTGPRLHLVQFIGPPRPEWVSRVRANGVRVISYVPTNAYLLYGDSAAVERLQAHAASSHEIQWNGAYLPEHKRPPITVTGDAYVVQMVEDASLNEATLAMARGLAVEPLRISRSLGYVNAIIRGAPQPGGVLAARPDVVSVLPYETPRLRDERQDVIIAGQLNGTVIGRPGYLDWLAARGFTQEQFDASGFGVDVSDSGLDNGTTAPNHFGLYVRGDVTGPSRVVYARGEGSPSASHTLAGCDGHGTLNAHIVGGYGDRTEAPFVDTEGYRFGLGVAPFVRLGSSVIFDPWLYTFPVFEDLQSRAYGDGMRVSSNSWGSGEVYYNSDSQRFDALVRDASPAGAASPQAGNQEMTIVFSAGNGGADPNRIHIGAPGNSKNVITVGASESLRLFGGPDRCAIADLAADAPLEVAFFSSAGPTLDGRTKPDIIAPGTRITGGLPQSESQRSPTPANPFGQASTCFDGGNVCGGLTSAFYPDGQQWYTASSGTSHSAPAVAGAAALLRQWFLNQGLPGPSPAMTKAYLVNSARYASGAADDLPSRLQGMGLLDLGVAFDATARLLRDEVAEDLFTATGQVRVFQGVADPAKPVRVTLAWTDAPGPTFAAAWVNDLDLTVTAGGITYLGNVFAGALSTRGGAPDRKNNLESVFLPPGTSGPFTVTVTAASIGGDGVPGNETALDQDFALVVSNACMAPVPPVPANVVLTPGNANEVTVTWGTSGSPEYVVERADSAAGPYSRIAALAAPPFIDTNRSDGRTSWYRVRARSGCAVSDPSAPVSVVASGKCLLPPRFAGLSSAQSTGQMTCGNALSWSRATPSCGGSVTYEVHRSSEASFAPSSANVIAATDATSYVDSDNLISGTRYWYIVRAVEAAAGGTVNDDNILSRSAAPSWTETIFADDFDSVRPADPSAYWREGAFRSPVQLSLVSGCHWESASVSYKFGAPGRCGGGYLGSTEPDQFALSQLVLGGDGKSPMNGFFIPPDAKVRFRFRQWFQFHAPTADIYPDDGAELIYSTEGPDGPFLPVNIEWEVLPPFSPAPFFIAGAPSTNDRIWHWSDEQANGELREVIVNADTLVNKTAWFGWYFLTRADSPEEGYYFDDVRLETVRTCSTPAILAADPVRFRIDGLTAAAPAGTDQSITVTALDASGQPASAFSGAATLTSNDPHAILPSTLVFAGGEARGSVQFRTTGRRAIQVADQRGLAHGSAVTLVQAADAVSIRFLKEPRSFAAGSMMPGNVEVVVEDVFGNGVPEATPGLSMGDNPGDDPWTGASAIFEYHDGHTGFMVGGICKAATGYTLVATYGPLRAKSIPFDVVASYAAALRFVHSPSVVVACEPLAQPVEVSVEDGCGNRTSSFDLISLVLDGPATLHGTTAVRPSNGVASFPDLLFDGAGTGNTLVATTYSSFPTGARSPAFDVTAGSTRRLAIEQQPGGARAGAPFLRPLTVRLVDGCGSSLGPVQTRILASLATNVAQAHLGGTTTVDTVAGVARFADLTLDRAIAGYSLRVHASDAEDATSATFDVSPGALTHFAVSGPASLVSGSAAVFTVSPRDGEENPIFDYRGTATVSVTDPRAQTTSRLAFNSHGSTPFPVVFGTPGSQTVSLVDLEVPGVVGSATVEVTARPVRRSASGGCGSAEGSGAASLVAAILAVTLHARRRRSAWRRA